jgi:iron complex outermembrane receptor protein
VKIKDVIGTVTAQEIVDRDNGDDPRDIPAGLGVTRNPITGAITEILAGYANEGTLKTSGLDLSVDGRWTASFGKFRHNLTWAHMFEYKDDGDDLAGDQGIPKDRIVLSNNWMRGEFDVAWNFNYIGKNGEGSRLTKAYLTHDLQVNWSPSFVKGAKLTVGALNLGDKQPELIRYDGRNFNFYLYDSYGRQLYFRYTQKF